MDCDEEATSSVPGRDTGFMRCPLSRKNNRRYSRSRRWLATLVVACCITSSSTAQSPPSKSSLFFKSAVQAPQVRPQPSGGTLPQITTAVADEPSVFQAPPSAGSSETNSNNAVDVSSNHLRLPPPSHAPGLNADGHAVQGDAGGTLTLAALENMALSANPSLGRASAEVAAARGAAVQAGLPFNPSIGYEGQQLGSGGLAEQHGLLFSQEFLRHEKRTLSRAVACREVQMAEYRFQAQRARVLTDVRMAFYRTLRAQRQVDTSEALYRISQQGFEAAKALEEAKEISRTDVLQAQIEVETAHNILMNAKNQLRSAWSQLAAVTGQYQLQMLQLEGDLFAPAKELEFDAVLAWLRGSSPEIAVAVADVERARLNWQRQRVEPRPNVSVEGLYNFVDNGANGQPDAGLAVSVPVPLYNRNQGAIQQARYEVVAAERSLAQLEFALQQRLAPVYERYSNAKNTVQQYAERILPAAEEVLQLTQKTFEVGEIGFTNLLIVQRSYRQLQLAYLDAAESLRISESEIDGLLLSGSLTEPPQ